MPDGSPGLGHNGPPEPIPVPIPEAVLDAFFDEAGKWRPSRFKVLWGGRGGGKSEGIARILVGLVRASRIRVLCTRMFQNSIQDSVHKTIAEAIDAMGLGHEFDVQKHTIIHRRTGSDFIFKGLKRDINGIKSLKGINICWVEEADKVPFHEWMVLDPTIRGDPFPGTDTPEIWISYNPDIEDEATHQIHNVKAKDKPEYVIREVRWSDNPFFPEWLNRQRLNMLRDAAEDPAARANYDWVWEGKCRKITDATIFRARVVFDNDFTEPKGMRPLYGADWGFADDPAALIRCYHHDDCLWITDEMFTWHTELDDLPAKFDEVAGAKLWPIKADNARPETISYMKRIGKFNISAAKKWEGCVEDGVEYLRAFRKIYVHPRCKHIAQEFRLYSYKTDPKQLDDQGKPLILPIIVDKWNHGIDALRYAHDGYIQGKSAMKVSKAALERAKRR